MELRVHLKVCEACGCLWFRAQVETTVYCAACYKRFKDFPTPVSRRRKGRPKKANLPTVFAVQESSQLLAERDLRTTQEFTSVAGIAGDGMAFPSLSAQASQCIFVSLTAGVL